MIYCQGARWGKLNIDTRREETRKTRETQQETRVSHRRSQERNVIFTPFTFFQTDVRKEGLDLSVI